MNSSLVEIFLPATGQAYDVRLPLGAILWDVLPTLGKLLSHLSDGAFQADDIPVLCERSTGKICNANLTVQELGLTNGSELMLI